MSETVEATAKTAKVGLAIKSAVTTIKPGPTIVTFWQGIADLIIRGVLVAAGLVLFIVGAIFGGNFAAAVRGYNSAGGWLAFVAFVMIGIEVAIIIGRFINFAFVYQYALYVMIVDVIIHGVAAFLVFPGFIASAVYASQLLPPAQSTAIALTIFALVYMGVLIVMAVFAFLWYFLKWYETLKNKYEGGTTSDPVDYED
jgi:hypothetical protein